MLKYYYQVAIASTGSLYLEAEQQLIDQGEAAVVFLQEQQKNAAPIAQLIIEVILQKIAGNEVFQACLEYFDQVEEQTLPTAKGIPSVEGVANYLIQTFNDRVATLLSVYLIKLNEQWANWRILSIMLYLSRLNSNLAADPLIHFIRTTANPQQNQFAVKALVAVGNATVLSKLETVLQPIKATQASLQQAADQIRAAL